MTQIGNQKTKIGLVTIVRCFEICLIGVICGSFRFCLVAHAEESRCRRHRVPEVVPRGRDPRATSSTATRTASGPAWNSSSLYTDQVPKTDMSRDLAKKHGFKIYKTISDCLTLGGKTLAVEGVLSIGEHGNYPENEKGQTTLSATAVLRGDHEGLREVAASRCQSSTTSTWPPPGTMRSGCTTEPGSSCSPPGRLVDPGDLAEARLDAAARAAN